MPKRPDSPPKARKTPKQSRSQQTRRDLLDGATRVLNDAGASGFNTNRVAEVTGVSIGSLYQYYPNKGALLADLHAVQSESVFGQLQLVLRDERQTPSDRLRQVVLGAFAAQAAGEEHHRALHSAGVSSTEISPLTELGPAIDSALREFFGRSLPERASEAPELAALCVEVLFGLLGRMAENPQRDWLAIAERTATMLVTQTELP